MVVPYPRVSCVAVEVRHAAGFSKGHWGEGLLPASHCVWGSGTPAGWPCPSAVCWNTLCYSTSVALYVVHVRVGCPKSIWTTCSKRLGDAAASHKISLVAQICPRTIKCICCGTVRCSAHSMWSPELEVYASCWPQVTCNYTSSSHWNVFISGCIVAKGTWSLSFIADGPNT